MGVKIGENIQAVRERIARAAGRAGRDPADITLVVVSKGVSAEAVREAAAGAGDLGENRVQEALPKMAELPAGIRWHLIGHLQKNKVRHAVGLFDLIHTVDSPELAREIELRASRAGIRQRVLIQINLAREPQKHGTAPGDAASLAHEIRKMEHLSLEGLMALPPYSENPEESRTYFRQLAEIRRSLRREGLEIKDLSMGMSHDFEAAVEEGATLVRVGTAIFGPRPG